ncbi:MAG: hypothetical protein JKY37_33490 [Nannocystaceae bacterium]|nr:hypothetical protein [Nannocystaceae bacterium]
MSNKLATTFALSAAALFLAGCKTDKPTTVPEATAPTADADKKVRCYGANECSGQTACDVSGKWDCAGNNDCCGKGWIFVSKSQCDEVGGGQDESFLENVAGICEGKGAETDADADPAADATAEG